MQCHPRTFSPTWGDCGQSLDSIRGAENWTDDHIFFLFYSCNEVYELLLLDIYKFIYFHDIPSTLFQLSSNIYTVNRGDFGQRGYFGQFFNISVLFQFKEFHNEVIMSERLITELHNKKYFIKKFFNMI